MPSKHGVGGSNPFVGAIFFMQILCLHFSFVKLKVVVKLKYMENKYYQEQELAIKELIANEKFEEALKSINEELSMPYIPQGFESFLLEAINSIPLSNRNDSYSLSLSKITDLLIKLDKSKNDVSDLIKHMSKFNLNEEKEELEYYFSKSTNTRNRAMVFELLINMKVDIECEYGNPSSSKSITELPNYVEDSLKIEKKLDKYPTFGEITIELLKEIYLTTHIGQKLEGSYADMVIYTTAQMLKQEDIMELIDDLEDVKNKLESFKSFEHL